MTAPAGGIHAKIAGLFGGIVHAAGLEWVNIDQENYLVQPRGSMNTILTVEFTYDQPPGSALRGYGLRLAGPAVTDAGDGVIRSAGRAWQPAVIGQPAVIRYPYIPFRDGPGWTDMMGVFTLLVGEHHNPPGDRAEDPRSVLLGVLDAVQAEDPDAATQEVLVQVIRTVNGEHLDPAHQLPLAAPIPADLTPTPHHPEGEPR
jgi:hypothetical protein